MLLITANWIKTVGTGVRKGGMIMFVKQLSVFMENREGRLEQAAEVLKQQEINILSLSMADTTEYGMLRMVVSDPEQAQSPAEKWFFCHADRRIGSPPGE